MPSFSVNRGADVFLELFTKKEKRERSLALEGCQTDGQQLLRQHVVSLWACVCGHTMSGQAAAPPAHVCPDDIWPSPSLSPVQSPAGGDKPKKKIIKLIRTIIIAK